MKNVANYALLRCKTFGLKIRRCKFFDKYHVCTPITVSTVSAVYSAVLPLSLMVFLVLGRSRAPLAWWPIIASIIDGACSRFSCWVGQPTMAPAKRWSIISVFHKLESKWPSQDCLSGMIGDLYQLIKAVVQKGKFSPSVWSCVVALISFLESRSQN